MTVWFHYLFVIQLGNTDHWHKTFKEAGCCERRDNLVFAESLPLPQISAFLLAFTWNQLVLCERGSPVTHPQALVSVTSLSGDWSHHQPHFAQNNIWVEEVMKQGGQVRNANQKLI